MRGVFYYLCDAVGKLTKAHRRENDMAVKKEIKIFVQSKVKAVYQLMYPTDTLGDSLRPELSFKDVAQAMSEGKEFYGIVFADGNADSIVRERIFLLLSELYGVTYDVFYNAWLRPETNLKHIKELVA